MPGVTGTTLGPLAYIESLEQMKYLNFSAFPKKVRMSLDYKPVLAATNATEFLLTRNSVGDY